MVPRRKLINHGEAKATRTAAAAETSETAGSHSRTLISPNDETPTSNGLPARRRVAAQVARPATPASSVKPALNGADAAAAASNAVEETSAMPSPTRRHCRARDDGCSVVHGTSKSLYPLEHQRAVGAAESERVLQRNVNTHVARGIGAVVEITLGILVEDVDGRRRDLMV
jgi:hypothetical protein